jgi:hypothetical protein
MGKCLTSFATVDLNWPWQSREGLVLISRVVPPDDGCCRDPRDEEESI